MTRGGCPGSAPCCPNLCPATLRAEESPHTGNSSLRTTVPQTLAEKFFKMQLIPLTLTTCQNLADTHQHCFIWTQICCILLAVIWGLPNWGFGQWNVGALPVLLIDLFSLWPSILRWQNHMMEGALIPEAEPPREAPTCFVLWCEWERKSIGLS